MENKQMEMYCAHCGKLIKKSATFCVFCGSQIDVNKSDNPAIIIKDNQKQCPICKSIINKQASKCPNCQSDLTVAGNIGAILWSIGIILTICITIPTVMFSCGMCSIP